MVTDWFRNMIKTEYLFLCCTLSLLLPVCLTAEESNPEGYEQDPILDEFVEEYDGNQDPIFDEIIEEYKLGGKGTQEILIDRIVAVVEDDAVMESELDERVSMVTRRLSKSPNQLPPRELLKRQVLERVVLEHLQLQVASRRGIRIDDLSLNEAMRNIANRNKLSLEEFRDALVQDGIDYVKFREQVRNELIIDKLRARVVNSKVQVTDQEVNELIASQTGSINKDSEYWLRHILISVPEAASPDEVKAAREKAHAVRDLALNGEDFAQLAISDSDGRNSLEGGDLGWRKADQLPSIFERIVVNLSKDEISEIIRSPSGFHIVKLEDVRGKSGGPVNQTRARHILLRSNAVMTNDKARRQLRSLKQRIVNGEDFARLAKANSDDTGSAIRGGDLGWTSPGDLVPEFEEAMDRLRIGEISDPFQTPFGWHIVEVIDRRRQDSSPDVMRTQARDIVRRRKIEEETELWLRRLRDESYVEYRLEAGDQG